METFLMLTDSLPPVLYLQMDNCYRENENLYAACTRTIDFDLCAINSFFQTLLNLENLRLEYIGCRNLKELVKNNRIPIWKTEKKNLQVVQNIKNLRGGGGGGSISAIWLLPYYNISFVARNVNERYLSIIIDGMDQA